MQKKIVYRSQSHNPYFNIAFEHYLFNRYAGEDILYLWCNQPSVIIGRFQNPWTECKLSAMQEKGVFLVRRESGGGAVFHDLGNGIFSFYSPFHDEASEARNYERLIRSLDKFGIKANQSSRNDLTISVNGEIRKVSGNAFKKKGKVSLQHGTMLIDTHLEELANYLTPNPKKLASKGIASVRSRVINLNELNSQLSVENFHEALANIFWQENPLSPREEIWINESLLETNAELKTEFDNLQKEKWLLGKTPQFNHTFSETFDFGSWEVHLDVEDLIVREVRLFTDCLSVDFVNLLTQELTGSSYTKEGMEKVFRDLDNKLSPAMQTWAKALKVWFIENIS